jgi:periplasmic protein TonB
MNAAGQIVSDRRAETARWVLCFAVVVGAHGFGAMALMDNMTEESDFGVDTPVVVIDLPESFVTSPALALDLPPGPLDVEQSDPTPPQKEETKPPEPEAEVALPMPEPPKPKPPQEERQATAPPQANAPRSIARWESTLVAHLERFKRYPQEARARGDQGTAKISFTIDHEGHLLSSRIVQSSGSAMLDQETLDMLGRAQPMPKPPDNILEGELSFVVPINFNFK